MTAEQIIKEVIETASEWLEMSPDPAALVAGILAKKVIKLQDHIEYLEKRLSNVSRSNNTF